MAPMAGIANRIVFIEVVKPERLVYKHAGDEDTEPVSFHVTVIFEKIGHKTKITMNSIFRIGSRA